MKSDERLVCVIGEEQSGRSTLTNLITSKNVQKKSFVSVTQIDFDYAELYGSSVLQVSVYKAHIDRTQLLQNIIRTRKPFRAFVVLCIPFSDERLCFTRMLRQIDKAKALLEFAQDSAQHKDPGLMFAFSKFDLFLQSSSATQEHNRRMAYGAALCFKASLLSFCSKSVHARLAAAAQNGLHSFIRQKPVSTTEPTGIFDWRPGQSVEGLPEEWAEREVTLEELLVEFGDEERRQSLFSEQRSECAEDDELLSWPALDVLLAEKMKDLSSD